MTTERDMNELVEAFYASKNPGGYWDAMNAGIVPEWAYQMDVHAPVVYNMEDHGEDFTLTSVAQQWKDDMRKRVAAQCKANDWCTPDHFRFRAPEEFIKTGRWPKDAVRPSTISVADRKDLPNV